MALSVADAAAAVGARGRLRVATRAAHDRAESVPVLAALARGRIDRSRYVAMLKALFDLFDRWESAQRHFLDRARVAHGWIYASRRALIARDLAELGVDVSATSASAISAARRDPFRWGMLYVVEGSALGGRLLADRVASAMPGTHALRYLDAGRHRAQVWPDFCAALERALPDAAAIDDAIAGADAMFLRYENALQGI